MPAAAQQNYPDKAIHVLLGFLPGTSSDIFSRFYTKKLQDMTGQPVILENKPGLFGLLPGGVVARAKPDGYNIWFTPSICRPIPDERGPVQSGYGLYPRRAIVSDADDAFGERKI